jgi:hypothetical protein
MPIRQRRLSREDICAALTTMILVGSTENTSVNATDRSTPRTRQSSSSNSGSTRSSEQLSLARNVGRVDPGRLLRHNELKKI